MGQTRTATRKRYNEVLSYIQGFSDRYGYSPTFREIGEALHIRSVSTVSRYVHKLIEDGEISCNASKPRTLSPIGNEDNIETVRQRICLEVADGGRLYVDCNLQKPKAANVRVSFDGVLDAKALKSRVGRIVCCNAHVE